MPIGAHDGVAEGAGKAMIDTPGMRELGLLGTSDGLDDTFVEIREYSADCRFSDCTHTGEPGCAVRLALENGTLSENGTEAISSSRGRPNTIACMNTVKR
jgi:putative ribosome biogenesis GTPase RsgA